MPDESGLAERIASMELDITGLAVGLLWYFRATQEYDERTPRELANDLEALGFPKPPTKRLRDLLNKSRYAVNGVRSGTKKVNVRYIKKLDEKYASLLTAPTTAVSNAVIPLTWVTGTKIYLELLVRQMNGCYDYGFYDGSVVLMRRLMETLIVESYIFLERAPDIRDNNGFFMLERLIRQIKTDPAISLGRNTPRTMDEIKHLGDTAAHDRNYIMEADDISDLRAKYRVMIKELLSLSGIRT